MGVTMGSRYRIAAAVWMLSGHLQAPAPVLDGDRQRRHARV